MTIIILIFLSILILFGIANILYLKAVHTKTQSLYKALAYQQTVLVNIKGTLNTKHATNVITENSEMIYQDLLQNMIPIMASLDIMPRATSEHSLWRSVGGMLDEYAKNPYTLEKLRRAIKRDTDVASSVNKYINRANSFLSHLQAVEPDGILTSTFTNGILGQSIKFFEHAKEMASQDL